MTPIRFTRRDFLAASGAALAWAGLPPVRAADGRDVLRLRTGQATFSLAPHGPDAVQGCWGYGGTVPGPVIRVRQGTPLRVVLENGLTQDTTIHWHGIRLPNAMDGVPHLTQAPVAPGGRFEYAFVPPDAGTYWYHPHANAPEQLGRGLSGALIVEEPKPYPADRDLVWLLDDWMLDRHGHVVDGFDDYHARSHDGRVGNTVTINGALPDEVAVRPHERIRLRLINAANARIFRLRLGDLPAHVIALDGQPVAPFEAGRVVLGPGMRADLVLDVTLPAVSPDVVEAAVARGIPVLVGTSGWTAERLQRVRSRLGDDPQLGVIVVPNFSLGSVVATRLATIAAPYFDSIEIIEAHHAGKSDSPSGTAIRTAELIAEANANVVEVLHTRHGGGLQISEVELELHIETRGSEHAELVLSKLREAGYRPRVDF